MIPKIYKNILKACLKARLRQAQIKVDLRKLEILTKL